MGVFIYVCVCVCVFIYICVWVGVFIYVCVCVWVCVCEPSPRPFSLSSRLSRANLMRSSVFRWQPSVTERENRQRSAPVTIVTGVCAWVTMMTGVCAWVTIVTGVCAWVTIVTGVCTGNHIVQAKYLILEPKNRTNCKIFVFSIDNFYEVSRTTY